MSYSLSSYFPTYKNRQYSTSYQQYYPIKTICKKKQDNQTMSAINHHQSDNIGKTPEGKDTEKQFSKLKKTKGTYKGNTIKYKTEICKFWEETHQCKFGDTCLFAHGKDELRVKDDTKKAKRICIEFYKLGSCANGSNCKLLHLDMNNIYSFSDNLKRISRIPFEAIKEETFIFPKRLTVFSLLTQDNSDRLSTEECEDSNEENPFESEKNLDKIRLDMNE